MMNKIRSIFGGLKCVVGFHQPFGLYDGTITSEKGVMTYIIEHCVRCNAYLGTNLDYELWGDLLEEEK